MSAHLGINEAELYPQPGGSVHIGKDGKWTGQEVFHIDRASAAEFAPRPGAAHPDFPWMTIDSTDIQFPEGDIAEVTCHYAGAEPQDSVEDEKANAVYSTDLSISEEPLLANSRYDSLSSDERKALIGIAAGREKDADGKVLRDEISSALGLEVLEKFDRGQTSYYSPKIVWRERWVRDTPLAAAELNDIGKIDTPSGPAPELAGDRNWLHNGATQEQDGSSYTLELSWLASDKGGWDPDIYS